jgi:CubicO group peptidase (beta-lactamase class C family)
VLALLTPGADALGPAGLGAAPPAPPASRSGAAALPDAPDLLRGDGPPLPGVAYEFPGEDWGRARPEAMGFDRGDLRAAVDAARAADSSCFLVARRGRVVGEWYWNGASPDAAQPVFSVTKSVTSTLVGLAEEAGALSLDDRASDTITSWRGTASEDVTVGDLLANVSGRHWDYFSDYGDLFGAFDSDAHATGLGQDAPPGTTWVYNNAAIQSLHPVLREAVGGDVARFAEERLFAPLGMTRTRLSHDRAGNTLLYSGLRTTCRDLARFGYLHLRHGDWDGRRVVPADWVERSTGGSSQDLNAAYGLLWWVNARGRVAGSSGGLAPDGRDAGAERADTRYVPGAPGDMFFAIGLGGQMLAVDPGSETVVVRLGPEKSEGFSAFYDAEDAAAVVTEAFEGP